MKLPINPRIEQLAAKKLVGHQLSMSFSKNLTPQLWRGFMPHRDTIKQSVSNDLFSLQVYPPNFFKTFNPETPFTKWAAKEVSDFSIIPSGMESFELQAGLYAVFQYKGDASDAAEFFRHIIGVWLPHSEYALDNRPHFEILGATYQHGSPDSEEEIWIPVKPKS
jgi:AraC family transcriptional regulator